MAIFRNYLFNPLSTARRLVFIILFFVFGLQFAGAQVCDKKTMVFFETDQHEVINDEATKLQNLAKEFSQKTDTFLLEIYAFTDSVASVDYNFKLAQKRFKSIVKYLKKNSEATLEIIEKVRGEASPLSSNATEAGRARNRRVEIYYFNINGGRVTLKGKRGMELDIKRDYFAPRGICECNLRLSEIFTNAEANMAGISMLTQDSCPLITAGMISMSFEGQDANNCSDVAIRIPAAKYDSQMEIWNATPLPGGTSISGWVRESAGQMAYDEKSKIYTLSVKLCPGVKFNIDKLGAVGITGKCRDSAAVVALPELNRFKKIRNYRLTSSNIITKEGLNTVTMAKFSYDGKRNVVFVDSGMTKERVGYYFKGSLKSYEMQCDSARCNRLKECWCYEIPLSAYTKLIYYQKKMNYRLKVPRKFRHYSVRLFIPGADSLLTVNPVKGSKRKYTFQQPLPDTYVVLYKASKDPNNKRIYDHQVDLEKIHKRYSKKKKVYKAKIKRRQLRHEV